MRKCFALLTAVVAVLAFAVGRPSAAEAATSSAPFSVTVTAAAIAAISISANNITCAPTDASNLHFPCSTSTATGSIRSTGTGGSASLAVSSPAGPIAGTNGNSIPISALQITCTSTGTGVNATPATLATQAALTASATTSCATWTTLPVVSVLNVLISFFINDTVVAADTYTTLTGFNVTATAT
jgi:hypothetical protein